jgi:hypothetical protein
MEVGFMKRFTAITMITAIMAVLLATFVPIMVGASGDDFGIRFTTDADDRLQLDTEGSVFKQTDGEKAWAKFITKYRNFIVGVSGELEPLQCYLILSYNLLNWVGAQIPEEDLK